MTFPKVYHFILCKLEDVQKEVLNMPIRLGASAVIVRDNQLLLTALQDNAHYPTVLRETI